MPVLESLHRWESGVSCTAATRTLVHTVQCPFFLPVFLATHGQIAHLNRSTNLCYSSLYIFLLLYVSLFLFNPAQFSFFLFLSSTIQKGTGLLVNPLFPFTSFAPLDLFFHGVEWFLRPVFFPALLKHRVTSLWRAVDGDQSLTKSMWSIEAEPTLLSWPETSNYRYRGSIYGIVIREF